MRALLEVRRVRKAFGGVVANDDISLSIDRGEITGLIGPNGSGKSTLFNCIARSHALDDGTIIFDGRDITRLKASQVSRLGVGRTFQRTRMISSLSVMDNVLVGAFCSISDRRRAHEIASEAIDFAGIGSYASESSIEVPTAVQKRVDLARTLATGPKLLMLDEFMAGLNATEIQDIAVLLRRLADNRGIALFISEHVMEVVMQLCKRIIVLDGGRNIAEGPPAQVVHDERVIRAYLGDRYAKHQRD